MRHLIRYIWGILSLFFCPVIIADNTPDTTDIFFSSRDLNTDPITGKRYFGTFKISTLQVLFSEAPFTLEIFLRNELSMQFQAGIIFPLESDSFLEQFFRSTGENSSASPHGVISYRNSPYNNHGLSFKYEIRRFHKSFYYAPQLMYKYCAYDKADFPVYIEDKKMRQTESKFSRIFGIGLMLGRQTYFRKQSTDWYVGGGIRKRDVSATVLRIEDPIHPSNVSYPDKTEVTRSIYPFLNFGFRLGFVL